MASIEWQNDLGYAEDSASSSRKPILLYYDKPECLGCQQMDVTTYSTEQAIGFVKEYLIPVKIDVEKKSYYEKYNVIWTPTTLLLDYQGTEIQRTIGYLDLNEFLAFMHLGIAKVHINNSDLDAANVHLNRLFDQYPDSCALPEAIFFQGINLSKKRNDRSELKNAYEKLVSEHPESSWAKRATPYRLI